MTNERQARQRAQGEEELKKALELYDQNLKKKLNKTGHNNFVMVTIIL